MNISPRVRLILVAIGIALLAALLFVVLVVPQIIRLGRLADEVAAARAAEEQAGNLLEMRQGFRDRAVMNDAELLQLANALPENPELPMLIIELQDRAYESGVIVRSIQPEDPVKPEGKPYVEMTLNFTVWGAWEDTVDYLQGFQKMARLVRIVEVRAEPIPQQDREEQEPDLAEYDTTTQVRMTAYVLPPEEATVTAPPVTTPAP